MPVGTIGAFVAGVATGWVGRSMAGSTREALVETLVLAHRSRENLKRVVAEQVEWVEDMFAEGRARFEARRDDVALDDYVSAPEGGQARSSVAGARTDVTDIKKKRGHAA